MKKKLVFYWYVKPSGWCDIYDLHIKNLNTYKDIFDSALFVISHDDDTDIKLIAETKEKIKSVFSDTDFCDYKNSKEDRESKYFYNEIVLKLNDFGEDEAIFFAHNKGVDSVYVTPDDLLCWINSMYYFNLFDVEKVKKLLEDKTTCAIGTAKMDNYTPPAFIPFCRHRWMFTGTFFWVIPKRIGEYIEKNKVNVIPNTGRYYTEGFLGMIFPQNAEEIKCIGGNKVEYENFIDYIVRNLTNNTIDGFIERHGKIPYNGNLDIFVFAHKNFNTERKNHVYKIVCSSDCDIKSDNLGIIKLDCELSNVGFSEWQKIYEIYTKRSFLLKDYVGIAHYHRYLAFSDDVNYVPSPQRMDEIFQNADAIAKPPAPVGDIVGQYAFCHNINDFVIMMEIIRTDFPEWYDVAVSWSHGNIIFDSNILILKRDDFIGLCNFIFPILFKYCEVVGIDRTSDESFIQYVNTHDGYQKVHKENAQFNEQARICSYLAERLVVMYLSKYTKRIKLLEMVEK